MYFYCRTSLLAVHLVTIFGGLALNPGALINISFRGVSIDEPSCLQISHALDKCKNMRHIDFSGCLMGPKGELVFS